MQTPAKASLSSPISPLMLRTTRPDLPLATRTPSMAERLRALPLSFNEADVSDKPPWIQSLRKLTSDRHRQHRSAS